MAHLEVSKEIERLVEPFRRGSVVLMIAKVSDGDEALDTSQASFSILFLWDL